MTLPALRDWSRSGDGGGEEGVRVVEGWIWFQKSLKNTPEKTYWELLLGGRSALLGGDSRLI